MTSWKCWIILVLVFFIPLIAPAASQTSGDHGGGGDGHAQVDFPKGLESYHDDPGSGLVATLVKRAKEVPFNLVATLLFFLAIIHTFLAPKLHVIGHKWLHQHEQKILEGKVRKGSVHWGAEIFHFLGEIEVVFGLWAFPLFYSIVFFYDFRTAVTYISDTVHYTEPMFVVVIMLLAATRPILKLAEIAMSRVANLLGGTLTAWWFTILTIGPILGSFITEPAAMTISALLLANKFYELNPSVKLKYATIGLLFVNISVGGTLTHFAAPPVLMVAHTWDWDFAYMILHFGWKAGLGIFITNSIYYALFRKELTSLQERFALIKAEEQIQREFLKDEHIEEEFEELEKIVSNELGFTEQWDQRCSLIKEKVRKKILSQIEHTKLDPDLFKKAFDSKFDQIRIQEMQKTLPALLPESDRPIIEDPNWDKREDSVPAWVMVIHVLFMGWTVLNAHHPALFVAGLMFFMGFAHISQEYQNRIILQPALLVGFFLAGLVIHGGLQGWWIAPVLGALKEFPLMVGATILTAFNDNAAITYLSSLVPGFTPTLKDAVVAGAVTGGGLTVIANAPNPAGQSILKKYFDGEVSPLNLAKAALLPTIIMFLCFWLFK